MKFKKVVTISGFVLLGVISVLVFTKVMMIRFATGELYPHYSSQRTDPLGAQALFDSFSGLESVSVSRNFTQLSQIPNLDENSALFLIGLPRQSVSDIRAKEESAVIKAVKEKGARLVITIDPNNVVEAFQPQKTKEEKDRIEERRRVIRERLEEREKEKKGAKAEEEEKNEEPEKGDEKKDIDEKADEEEKSGGPADTMITDADEWEKFIGFDDDEFEAENRRLFGTPIFDRWNLEFSTGNPDDVRPESGWEVEPGPDGGFLTDFPNWQSQHRFKKSGDWKTIAKVGGEPVVVERNLGKGTVVVASDSFFASNEALHLGGAPEFLMWLTGGKTDLVFDETIHGSSISVGSMKLIRKYRLHGFFVGLFVLVALWAWRTSSSLAPGSELIGHGVGSDGEVAGEEAGSGFVQLLRRSIPAKELITKCAMVWKESARKTLSEKEQQVFENTVQSNASDPKSHDAVSTYRRLAELLKRRV